MQYLVIIEESATSYGTYVPDLAGCIAVTKTKVGAHRLIAEAIQFHIEDSREDGVVVQPPSSTVALIDVATH